MEGVFTAEAVIDNGEFGSHTLRFETGKLAQQAAGSCVVYLDDETDDPVRHHGGQAAP